MTVLHNLSCVLCRVHVTDVDATKLVVYHSTVATTGALQAIKPEATAIGIIARWPLENNLNVWWAQFTKI